MAHSARVQLVLAPANRVERLAQRKETADARVRLRYQRDTTAGAPVRVWLPRELCADQAPVLGLLALNRLGRGPGRVARRAARAGPEVFHSR